MSFRRKFALRPVHSEKHEIAWTFLAQNASGIQTVDLIHAKDGGTDADHVDVGATVKGLYIEFNLNGVDNSGASQVFHWYVWKNVGSLSTVISPATYNNVLKRFILKRGMEMLPEVPLDSGGTVQTKRIFYVALPPRIRRMADEDKIQLIYVATSASGINFCGFTVYKEFT